jgi:hypothetical protein
MHAEVRVMCGTHRFQFFDLSSQRVFNRIRSGTTRSCAPYLIWEHMYGSPKNIGTSRARSLAKRIVRYAPNLCEKPRDRLYGLLSLVSEHDMDHGIEIDYKKPISVMYYDAVTFLHRDYHRNLDLDKSNWCRFP